MFILLLTFYFQKDGMMDKGKEEGAINLSTASKDTETDGPTITNGDISRMTSGEPDNFSQVIMSAPGRGGDILFLSWLFVCPSVRPSHSCAHSVTWKPFMIFSWTFIEI